MSEKAQIVALNNDEASKFASFVEVVGEDATELSKHVIQGDIAGIWEHCEDFEKLSEATIKTVAHLNEEHIKRMAQQLNANNEKMLNATFEGVKRHHKKQVEKLQKRYKQRMIMASLAAFMAGLAVGWLVFKLPYYG
ncbi:hypothetical protein [Campylobacter sp. 19-13652]|uniref:hypothetical protein n=1 Tax=Campylobacter sp. 19-13652 TaxID=2840180 RepID=UPI001C768322|nr:hypothetical protein [Campylobacter sp. 19-13652]BCX79056.1 hypothetical protein LBC_05180 [Campylobacter sp. 19-13652]